ncbi:MAG: Serine/threonine protein kinaserelated protein [Edaphobacter sp.]|nr:Serine/threonine protein kinaserelated protein [Edaphobacter sp.]
MNLWTEYEGRTIDGVYPLTKLIRPEGRSAFFSTSNGTGVPTVIRLIESHFDGDEILTRWRGVAALNHPNLVKLKSFGHVVVDETSLVYAVMEPVEANLSEILRERRLTEFEARQIATSLLAALEALHASGFVHEHVLPENVLAVGEVIKLRSDCIRETLEGADGVALKRKDVRDYATTLLQALTQQRTLQVGSRALPAPFEQIVRRGISGEWGLAEIGTALKKPSVAQAIARAGVTPDAPKFQGPVAEPAAAPSGAAAAISTPLADPPSGAPPSVARRIRVPVDDEPRKIGPKGIAYGVGTLLILLLGWYFVHSRSSGSSGAVQEPTASAPAAQESAPVAAKSPAEATDAGSHPAPSARVGAASTPTVAGKNVAGDSRGRWRVVAFTYNREDQAKQKVAEIARSHPDLSPTVFTPNGHAPFLVTLGGSMSREEAFALSGKAKREGLPRDTYAQNYRGSGN